MKCRMKCKDRITPNQEIRMNSMNEKWEWTNEWNATYPM